MYSSAKAYRFDEETLRLIELICKREFVTQSDALRRAIRFYCEKRGYHESNTTIFKEFNYSGAGYKQTFTKTTQR